MTYAVARLSRVHRNHSSPRQSGTSLFFRVSHIDREYHAAAGDGEASLAPPYNRCYGDNDAPGNVPSAQKVGTFP